MTDDSLAAVGSSEPTPRSAAAASKPCVSCQIKPTWEHTREEARACLDRLGFGGAHDAPTEHTESVCPGSGQPTVRLNRCSWCDGCIVREGPMPNHAAVKRVADNPETARVDE